jgi:hypothetical protein
MLLGKLIEKNCSIWSQSIPAICLNVGPMINGYVKDALVGLGMIVWKGRELGNSDVGYPLTAETKPQDLISYVTITGRLVSVLPSGNLPLSRPVFLYGAGNRGLARSKETRHYFHARNSMVPHCSGTQAAFICSGVLEHRIQSRLRASERPGEDRLEISAGKGKLA